MVSVLSLVPIFATILLLWGIWDVYVLFVKHTKDQNSTSTKFKLLPVTKLKLVLGFVGIGYTTLLSAKVNPVAEYRAPVRSNPAVIEPHTSRPVKDLTPQHKSVDEHSHDLDVRKSKGLPFADR